MECTSAIVHARDASPPSNSPPLRRRLSGKGSLPLKKRRCHERAMDESTTIALVSPQTIRESAHGSSNISSISIPNISPSQAGTRTGTTTGTETPEETIAALALVEAALSRPPTQVSSTYSPATIVDAVPSTPKRPPSVLVSCELARPTAQGSHIHRAPLTPTAPKRMHHPPLASPLPNGCHGRTSRNNSFCRRQPCYNGSKYCKLHYQQYIVAGIRSPSTRSEHQDGGASSSTSIPSNPAMCLSSSSVLVDGAPSLPSMHQDKRFTGSQDELRCQATTTRGRSCAYVAVNETKYCYLHADYDTNPPPRRGGASQRKAEPLSHQGEKTNEVRQDKSATTLSFSGYKDVTMRTPSRTSFDSTQSSSLAASVTASDASSESSMISSGSSTPVLQVVSPSSIVHSTSTADPGEENARRMPWNQSMSSIHNGARPDTQHTLLSMISTDQWFNKRVIVSTGPLVDRCGRVEKWGNGWVSVIIPGIGVHNRRSFELYLHPDQKDETSEEGPSSKHASVINVTDVTLRRCVSRETASDAVNSPSEEVQTTHWNNKASSSFDQHDAARTLPPLPKLESPSKVFHERKVSNSSSEEDEQQVVRGILDASGTINREASKPSLPLMSTEKPLVSLKQGQRKRPEAMEKPLPLKRTLQDNYGETKACAIDGLARLAEAIGSELCMFQKEGKQKHSDDFSKQNHQDSARSKFLGQEAMLRHGFSS